MKNLPLIRLPQIRPLATSTWRGSTWQGLCPESRLSADLPPSPRPAVRLPSPSLPVFPALLCSVIIIIIIISASADGPFGSFSLNIYLPVILPLTRGFLSPLSLSLTPSLVGQAGGAHHLVHGCQGVLSLGGHHPGCQNHTPVASGPGGGTGFLGGGPWPGSMGLPATELTESVLLAMRSQTDAVL